VKRGDSVSPASNPDVFVVKTSIAPPTFDAVPTPSNVSRPVFSGRGEAAAVLSVKESGTLLCQATVSAGGCWTCISPALPDGTHTASASQLDAAGNVSSSVSVTFAIDTHLPDAPTRDNKPRFSGTLSAAASGFGFVAAAAGPSVTVMNGETPLCSGAPDGTGHWSCSPTQALTDGSYLLVALLADGKGHFSGPSM